LKHAINISTDACAVSFLLYSPLNQGLKRSLRNISSYLLIVFTLQSIKSRIETLICPDYSQAGNIVFTLQSIKSRIETTLVVTTEQYEGEFLLYSPLNQGLKPPKILTASLCQIKFLLYSPLNQGLKLQLAIFRIVIFFVFTLQSIKSRIETFSCQTKNCFHYMFLLYSPLNQGLKQTGVWST